MPGEISSIQTIEIDESLRKVVGEYTNTLRVTSGASVFETELTLQVECDPEIPPIIVVQ